MVKDAEKYAAEDQVRKVCSCVRASVCVRERLREKCHTGGSAAGSSTIPQPE